MLPPIVDRITNRAADQEQSTQETQPPPPGDNGGPTLWQKMLEAAATSFASIFVVGVGFALTAYAYHKGYKYFVLKKMTNAFEPGDPVLELAAMGRKVPHDSPEAAAY